MVINQVRAGKNFRDSLQFKLLFLQRRRERKREERRIDSIGAKANMCELSFPMHSVLMACC
jgi:hypothetical protein